ncbi:hypothetical protein GWK47_050090 [Chionoecetes opilio]|uniref:Uncharacterized protein n=1 Tax=Chionoecetes opilio TaxID=41210 RepID=A0A8J4Y2X0_CHIOP|nr:hypothetical protein GWK47_050090 [Chionoecetes opilio]
MSLLADRLLGDTSATTGGSARGPASLRSNSYVTIASFKKVPIISCEIMGNSLLVVGGTQVRWRGGAGGAHSGGAAGLYRDPPPAPPSGVIIENVSGEASAAQARMAVREGLLLAGLHHHHLLPVLGVCLSDPRHPLLLYPHLGLSTADASAWGAARLQTGREAPYVETWSTSPSDLRASSTSTSSASSTDWPPETA